MGCRLAAGTHTGLQVKERERDKREGERPSKQSARNKQGTEPGRP